MEPISAASDDFPHPVGARDLSILDEQFPPHEDELPGFSHNCATDFDSFADLDRFKKLHVELHGGLSTGRIALSGRLAHRPIGERHQHPTLDIAGAILVLGFRMKAEPSAFVGRRSMEDRANKFDEAIIVLFDPVDLGAHPPIPRSGIVPKTSAPPSIANIKPITHPIAAFWFSP